jgi:hypothetical protein
MQSGDVPMRTKGRKLFAPFFFAFFAAWRFPFLCAGIFAASAHQVL